MYTVSFSQSIKYLYFNQEPASLCFSFCFKLRDQSRRNGVNYSNFNFFFLHYRLTTMQNLSFFVLFYMQNQLVSRYFIVTTKIYLKKKTRVISLSFIFGSLSESSHVYDFLKSKQFAISYIPHYHQQIIYLDLVAFIVIRRITTCIWKMTSYHTFVGP